MKWRARSQISNELIDEVSKELGVDPLMVNVLLSRGLSKENIRIVMNEYHEAIIDPRLLTNAEEAAKVIASYCRNPKATIIVFGDYDADGVSSTFTMTSSLREVAVCTVEGYCPERKEGYGLSMEFAKKLVAAKFENPVLVVTVDNGIACAEPVAYLQQHGIEVVVTDHHKAKTEGVPDCLIVDPHNHGEPDTFKHLSGCGVAFKVAQLVQEQFGVYNMANYLFAVAIGTVADVMPMTLENVALVKYGLEQMNSEHCPKGIKAMKDYLGKDVLTSTDLGWEIGPRINACGRLGNIQLAKELFFLGDHSSDTEVEEIVNSIERINTERKNFTDKAKKMMEKTEVTDEPVFFMDVTGFPEGVVGIIANKAIEKHNKPVFLMAGEGNLMTGSARSVGGLNLHEVLQPEQDLGNIVKWGGHEVAAGITIKREKFEELKANISRRVAELMPEPSEGAEEIEEELLIDEFIEIIHLNESTLDLLNTVPYDNKVIPAPVFALCDVEVVSTSCSKNNPNNIKFTIKDGTGRTDLWAWGFADQYEAMGSPKRLHIAGSVERNFMNKRQVTLKIVDVMGA